MTTDIERIAVFRALSGLGDILCTVPAMRALRAAFPQAEIVLIGLAAIKPLIKRFDKYIDRVLQFPGYPGLPEVPFEQAQIPTFIQTAQNERFDLAIQMHGSGTITNPVTVLLGARYNAGFFLPDQYCPDEKRFLPYITEESEVLRYLRLLELLGVPAQGTDLEFPVYESDQHSLEEIDEYAGDGYVCVHPGASTASRCWQPEKFAMVADAIAAMGYSIVLTGSAAEVELTTTVASLMKANSINLAGRTSLGVLAALLKQASLLICNDTGVSHLAAALQVKSVVIFTQSDPKRWAPLNQDRHRVVCSATGISIESVLNQAFDLLHQNSGCTV